MSILHIYADSRGPGTCRSCGAAVSGKRMPFNPPIVAVRTQGSILEGDGRAIEHVDSSVSTSHFSTCPDAREWRRRKP